MANFSSKTFETAMKRSAEALEKFSHEKLRPAMRKVADWFMDNKEFFLYIAVAYVGLFLLKLMLGVFCKIMLPIGSVVFLILFAVKPWRDATMEWIKSKINQGVVPKNKNDACELMSTVCECK